MLELVVNAFTIDDIKMLNDVTVVCNITVVGG